MIIFDSDSSEESRTSVLDTLAKGVGDLGGEIIHNDSWGMRAFAYPINKKNEGFYVVQEFTGSGEMTEIERTLRLADDVVRFKILHLPKEEVQRRIEVRENPPPPPSAPYRPPPPSLTPPEPDVPDIPLGSSPGQVAGVPDPSLESANPVTPSPVVSSPSSVPETPTVST